MGLLFSSGSGVEFSAIKETMEVSILRLRFGPKEEAGTTLFGPCGSRSQSTFGGLTGTMLSQGNIALP